MVIEVRFNFNGLQCETFIRPMNSGMYMCRMYFISEFAIVEYHIKIVDSLYVKRRLRSARRRHGEITIRKCNTITYQVKYT